MSTLPELPLEDWRPTRTSLHLRLQVLGKVRMALHPKINHWWHVPLYIGAQGFTTGPIPGAPGTLEIVLDVQTSQARFLCNTGATRAIDIGAGDTVAGFLKDTMATLDELGYALKIVAKPYDPVKAESDVPFAEDHVERPWDIDAIRRFWQINLWSNRIFNEFRGRFYGKHSPVHLFWHSMDLAYTRFSGRAAPMEGGTASDREAYSHEVTSVGFWAGDDNVPQPAFYAYAYPEPAGLGETALAPAGANWVDVGGSHMALLMYDDVRNAENPEQALLDFCESTYQRAAALADWDLDAFTTPWADASPQS